MQRVARVRQQELILVTFVLLGVGWRNGLRVGLAIKRWPVR